MGIMACCGSRSSDMVAVDLAAAGLVVPCGSGCRSFLDLAAVDLYTVDLAAEGWFTVDLFVVGLVLWMGLAFQFR